MKRLSLLFALPLVLVLAAQARGQITQGSGGSSGGGGTGTVTSVTGGNGLTGTVTTSGAISLPTATAGQILIENAGATGFAAASLSADCTVVSTGAITCLSTNGVAFTSAATGNAAGLTSGVVSVARGGTGAGTLGGADIFVGGTTTGTPSAMQNVTLFNCKYFPAFTIQTGFTVNINTLDGTGVQDLGIFSLPSAFGAGTSSTATLITDTGARTWPSATAAGAYVKFAALQNASCTGATAPSPLCTGSGTGTLPTLPLNEPAGYYCFGATSNGTTAKIGLSNVSSGSELANGVGGATTNGQLNGTMTSLTIAPILSSSILVNVGVY